MHNLCPQTGYSMCKCFTMKDRFSHDDTDIGTIDVR